MQRWGFIAIDRGLWGHPFFKPEPFTERESWVWLISAAAYKPMRVAYQNIVVLLKRGEFCFSLRFLAEKWRWEKDKVDRYLKRLQRHDMLRDNSRDGAKVYFITNYNKFNSTTTQERDNTPDSEATAIETPPRHDRDKEEQINNLTSKTPSLRSGDAPKRKTQIPENIPSQADLQAAVKFWTERGRTDLCATVDDEAAQFRDRCTGDGVTALDWSAKWRTWYRNALRFNKSQKVNGHGRRESPLEQAHRIANELTGYESPDHRENHSPGNVLPQITDDRRRA